MSPFKDISIYIVQGYKVHFLFSSSPPNQGMTQTWDTRQVSAINYQVETKTRSDSALQDRN